MIVKRMGVFVTIMSMVIAGLLMIGHSLAQSSTVIVSTQPIIAQCDQSHRTLSISPIASDRASLVCHDMASPSPSPSPSSMPTMTPSPLPSSSPSPSPSSAPIGQHPMGCGPNDVFIDAQDWWLHPDPARNFGHLHTAFCWPHMQMMNAPWTITVISKMHNNPGVFHRLAVQAWEGGVGMCNIGNAIVCLNFNRTLATCTETGGVLQDQGQTCTWRDTIVLDPALITSSGMKQFRFRGFIREPDGTEMRTSTGVYAMVDNGKPRRDTYKIGNTYDVIEARGWYTDANYAVAVLFDPPQGPVSGVWTPSVRMEPGVDGVPVTSHYAALDTDFHNNNPGIPVKSGSGPYRGTLSIDTRSLSEGWHRLFMRSDQAMPTGHTHSGVLATWFLVDQP